MMTFDNLYVDESPVNRIGRAQILRLHRLELILENLTA